jgi:hypothetical protein
MSHDVHVVHVLLETSRYQVPGITLQGRQAEDCHQTQVIVDEPHDVQP